MNFEISTIVFPCQLIIFHWLGNHLLPCPFKYITGMDCPGCGFQRSIIALLQGDLHKSIALYPPAIPIILTFMYIRADKRFNLDNNTFIVKKAIFVVVSLIIVFSYGIKMWHLYHYHNISA